MGEPLPQRCTVDAWQPAVPGIAEVFHAHIVDYAYPAHCHDTWTVLIVDSGAIDYALDRRRCGAVPATVALLPPGVIHDGRPASRARHGFRKRNLYLDPGFLPEDLIGAAVDKTQIGDPGLRRALSDLHDSLRAREDALDGEARLALVAERIRTHLQTRPTAPTPRIEPTLAHRLRRYLDEHALQRVTLTDAVAALDRSAPHLIRSFTAAFGLSPHAYIIGRRIEAARPMLLDGIPPAEVATAVGFFDQAHLTRHFKRHVSTTPARYARRHAPHRAGAHSTSSVALDSGQGSASRPDDASPRR